MVVSSAFCSCGKHSADDCRIVYFKPNGKYYLKLKFDSRPGGVFDGTVSGILVKDKQTIIAKVDRLFDGDPDGIYIYRPADEMVSGPISKAEESKYSGLLVDPKFSGLDVATVY